MGKVNVGDKFGRFTVLEIGVKNPDSKAKKKVNCALCKCECGNLRYVEYRDLYDGRRQSCGCLKHDLLVERNFQKGTIALGTRFGKLQVIEDLGYRKQNYRDKQIRWWKCQCDCGNIIEVCGNNLRTGSTQSCGCVQSFGEEKLSEIFRNNDINFSKQYTFKDLLSPKGYSLRFDFAIFKNDKLYCLVEFDGRQHVEGPDGSWTKGSTLEQIKEYNNLKNEYCKVKNIKLIRFNYSEYSKLNKEYVINKIFS